MTEAADIVRMAEAQGHEFLVHRGSLFIQSPSGADPYTRAITETARDEVCQYLLRTRGADSANLVELWENDGELRCHFRNLPELDDFAHEQGLRLLTLAITEMEISKKEG